MIRKEKKELVGVVSLKSYLVEWLIFESMAVTVEESVAAAIVAAIAIAGGCDGCLL